MFCETYPSLSQGLLGAWCPSMGATGFTLLDRSGRNQHGTLANMGGQNSWRPVSGVAGLSFDGVNDYVSATVPSNYMYGSFSASYWLWRPAAPQAYTGILGHANSITAGNTYPGWLALYAPSNAGGAINNCHYVSIFDATTQLAIFELVASNDSRWHHFAYVVDRGRAQAEMFKDGVSQGTSTLPPTTVSVTRPFELGRRPSSPNGTYSYASFACNDVRIFNRALPASDIRLLATAQGIGLSPMSNRWSTIPRKAWINVGGTWKNCDTYVNAGGSWRLSSPSVNVGGVWR